MAIIQDGTLFADINWACATGLRDTFYRFTQVWKAAGHSVYACSDGATKTLGDSLITSAASFGTDAWIVYQEKGGGRQFSVQLGSATSVRIYYFRLGDFDYASSTPTGVVVSGSGQPLIAGTLGAYVTSWQAATTTRSHIVVESEPVDGAYYWSIMHRGNTGASSNSNVGCFVASPVTNTLAADADPLAFIAATNGGTNIIGGWFKAGDASQVWSQPVSGLVQPTVITIDTAGTPRALFPVRAQLTTANYKGLLSHCYSTALTATHGNTFTDATRGHRYVQFDTIAGGILVRYPYSQIPLGSTPTDTAVETVNFEDPPVDPPDVTPPTATLVSPLSLTSIARDTPIVLELDDDTDLSYYVIVAVYPGSGIVPQLVVDGGDLGLDTGYTVSTELVGGKLQVSVLPSSGEWPAPGFLRARPIDGAGNYA